MAFHVNYTLLTKKGNEAVPCCSSSFFLSGFAFIRLEKYSLGSPGLLDF